MSSKELPAPSVKPSWCDWIAIAFIAFLFVLLLIFIIFAVIYTAEALNISILQYMHIRVLKTVKFI